MHGSTSRIYESNLFCRLRGQSRQIIFRQRNQILQIVTQSGIWVHLEPKAPQRVLHQKPDYPPGRKNLRGKWNLFCLDLLLVLVELFENRILLNADIVLIRPPYGLLISWLPGFFRLFSIEQVY